MNIKDTCFYMSTRNTTKEIKVDANEFALQPHTLLQTMRLVILGGTKKHPEHSHTLCSRVVEVNPQKRTYVVSKDLRIVCV